MTATVLSSNEKDLTKIVFAINQLAQGRSNAIWTSYTPILTPNVGSITTGGTAAYMQFGRLVLISINAKITAISGGPASATINIQVASPIIVALVGSEVGNTGKIVRAGFFAGTTTSVAITDSSAVSWVPALNDNYSFSCLYQSA
jgi:hypothetical protein